MTVRFGVLGARGMFGSELVNTLVDKEFTVVSFSRTNFSMDRDVSEIAKDFDSLDVVINSIAYTAVDKAEQDRIEAQKVNATYAGKLASAAKLSSTKFIQISTDYVFDGKSKVPYGIQDQVNPQSVYGSTKALGEELVNTSGADNSILRTSWLYGATGRCFPSVIADILKQTGRARVVGDQIGQPTWTRDLAEVVIEVATMKQMPKLVHAVSSGQGSWADFAREIAKTLDMDESVIEEISTTDYSTPARRPAWSVLDNHSELITSIGDWRERWKVAAPTVLGTG